jgi:8-oxo-dGTP diphosphatase
MQSMKMNRPFLAVRAIITNENGKVLILKRSNTIKANGKWCLPGGNVEYGQTIKEAVHLEIQQETSLITKEVKFLFYYENLPSEESELHYINIVFQCTAEGNLQLNHESSDYAWIDSGAMNNFSIAFRNNKILEKYWNLKT